jgi:hypothetical protein
VVTPAVGAAVTADFVLWWPSDATMKYIAMAVIGGIAGFIDSAVSLLFFQTPAMVLTPGGTERFALAISICGIVVGSCTGIVLALGSNRNSGHAQIILGAVIAMAVLITLALPNLARENGVLQFFFAFPLFWGAAVLWHGINCLKRKK